MLSFRFIILFTDLLMLTSFIKRKHETLCYQWSISHHKTYPSASQVAEPYKSGSLIGASWWFHSNLNLGEVYLHLIRTCRARNLTPIISAVFLFTLHRTFSPTSTSHSSWLMLTHSQIWSIVEEQNLP